MKAFPNNIMVLSHLFKIISFGYHYLCPNSNKRNRRNQIQPVQLILPSFLYLVSISKVNILYIVFGKIYIFVKLFSFAFNCLVSNPSACFTRIWNSFVYQPFSTGRRPVERFPFQPSSDYL